MAIATLNSHIYAALQLRSKASSTYLAIGRKTPWEDENNPPNEDPEVSELNEVIGYKKAKTVSLCRPLKDGETPTYPTVTYGDRTWVLIPDNQAYVEKAHYLYIDAEIIGEELPTGTWRQVGIHTDLAAISGVTKPNLLPSEVQNKGVLQFYENRELQNRTPQVRVLEQFIAEC